MTRSTARGKTPEGDVANRAAEMVLVASRALVGVAARSLATVEAEITLRQYRALVVLAARGELRSHELADALEIHPSTATRLCDRLIDKRLIERTTSLGNRREVTLALSSGGGALLREVTTRRRREIRRILARLDVDAQTRLVDALSAFAEAADELPDDAWKLGWTT